MTILEPELLYVDGAFRTGQQVEILDDGTFGRVGLSLGEATEVLEGEALLPGMANAHSHAFQRGLRGRAESYPESAGSFWTWREEMYRLVESLDERAFRAQTLRAFREMLATGITSVGEFHYLHHLGGSRDYGLDAVVLDAAREAGIRFVLLDVCYLTGDVGRPLEGAQRRFGSASVESFLESAERLEGALDRETQSLGLVAHSIRAAPIEAVETLHAKALETRRVFHMHVEEQRREIETTVARYGARPLELLLDRLEIGPETTAVHCTHSRDEDLVRLAERGANVCLCPLTEASLADGVPSAALAAPGHHVALGTDSNHRIDFVEEMRWLEYAQRLRTKRRGVFRGRDGSAAKRLFEIATEGGARSLGLSAGRVAPGQAADYFTLALDAPTLEAVETCDLLGAFVFGAGASAVKRVAVSGKRLV